MAIGTKNNTEFLQQRSDRATKDQYNIAKSEGRITDGMTMAQINQVLVNYIKEAETTSSNKTTLPSIPDNRAGSQVFINGENRSSGDAVGRGQWIGTFSGSADFFSEKLSGFSTFHFTHFSGAMSCSGWEVGCDGTADYGRVAIGKPDDVLTSNGKFINGVTQAFLPMSFSGSFIVDAGGANTINTPESQSAQFLSASGTGSLNNQYVPRGAFTAKWISGSFNNSPVSYSSAPNSMSADLGTTFYTSSTFTTSDLNAISKSRFVGSVCIMTGSVFGRFATGKPLNYGSYHTVPLFNNNYGKHLDATQEFGFTVDAEIGGNFRQDGSIVDNDNTGPIVSAVVAGALFAIAPSGSQNVSGSIESLEGRGFSNRGPKQAYKNQVPQGNFHAKKKKVSIKGARDEFQLKKLKEKKSTNFVSTGRKMTRNPLK